MSIVPQIRAMLASGLTIEQALDAAEGIERGARKKKSSKSTKDDRAHPLPKEEKDWLTPELARFALEELGNATEARRETDKFRNYWLGVPGARGRKLDWGLTYKNWIMKAADDRGRHRGGSRTGPSSRPSFAEIAHRFNDEIQGGLLERDS